MNFTSFVSSDDPKSSLTPFLRLLPYLWPADAVGLRLRVIASFFCLFLSKIFNLLVPLYFRDAVNALSFEKENSIIVLPLGILLAYGAMRILNTFFSEVRVAIFAPVGQHATRKIAVMIFKHLHRLSLRFHLARRTGGISRVIERGTGGIENFLWFSTNNIAPAILEVMFMTTAMWILYSWKFAFVTLVTITLYTLFTILTTEWRTHYVRKMNTIQDQGNARSIDALLNYETVKYFTNENYEEKRFDLIQSYFEKSAILYQSTLAVLNGGQGIIIAVGTTLIMILAAKGVVDQTLTVGDFVLVNSYLLQAFIPLGALGYAYRILKQSLVDMEGMFSLLDENAEIEDSPMAQPLKISEGSIEFRDVSFSYNPNRKILKHVSFQIPAGKTMAIVGESGAGKSTISRLLFRFYDVTEGAILIDGQDIREVTQESLRKMIGVVPQDTVLFNDTIYYNISYGNPEATKAAVEKAAQHAQIDTFIKSLPEGYNTLVGERGLKLSGGEKQRVAIARTLLKKPTVFLFDEATSSLDTKTEKEIQKNLLKISQNHTTLIIAHRLSTIIHADEILVLHKGKVVERGTHKFLLAQQGSYAHMWKHQQDEEHKPRVLE
ncbi:MAG TPA: ABC transporter ATP-binding protein/permease [Alphaproteobacteria bacterium]|nr:ABC transporter ATP-binding protein/permease [Alphaproteobacteria bacterium]